MATRACLALTIASFLLPHALTAQDPDTVSGRTLGIRGAGLKRDTVRLVLPDSTAATLRLARPRGKADSLAAAWAARLNERLAFRAALRWRAGLIGAESLLAEQQRLDAAPYVIPGARAAGTPSILTRYAELGLQMNARFEARLDRLRNLRCTAVDVSSLSSGCRGGFSPPRLEPQFSVRTGGIVGQRVHLNVDYDTEREFEASNNIQVYYQGLEDEIIRRVQVGNVTFAPPSSRFISGGLPSNNFGAQVEGQLGALEFSAIFAQQKGNVVRGRVFTIGDRTVQPLARAMQDRDFEPMRFFFTVDPASLPGYPAVDILNLGQLTLPAAAQVREVRLYRRRASAGTGTAEQNLTGIEAVALRPDSPQRAGPFVWELLTEGRDYYLDPTGLWFALASRLDLDDYLAVSYVTAAGDTVGTFPATSGAAGADTLTLISEPRRAADVPTFRYEFRGAYRVGSVDDVVRQTLQLRLLVAESERPCDPLVPSSCADKPTFLSLLGLGQANDASSFDQFNRLFPRQQDPGAGAPLRDFFIVFPHLTPLADSVALEDPQFRTDSLYRTPAAVLRTLGPTPLFQLRLAYDAAGGDDRRVLSLGAFQIREGSERLVVSGGALTRGVDYTINYEIGQVTFLSPDSLFRQPTTVSVQYEENPAFAIAPTSVYGLQTRYDLGDHGSIGAIGLLQRERTTYTRPPLGFEPSSSFVAGITGNFRFEPNGLTRLLDALPLISTDARSTLTLDAEIATSRPSPNQVGVAYVETFEDEAGSFLSLGEDRWELGSRPSSARGLAGAGIDVVNGFLDVDASTLVWQNLRAAAGGEVTFRARDIDPSIRLQGSGETTESVLWMTMLPDTVGGLVDPVTLRPRWLLPHTPGPRWRSMSLPLSPTGQDLTRIEFLEFWVYEDSARIAKNAGFHLVFDFGTVFEDAATFAPTGFRVSGSDTTFFGRRRNGEGRLDTERDTITNAFNAGINDIGTLGDVADSIRNLDVDTLVRNLPLCRSELGANLVVYPLGIDLVHCTRRNGRADTEDLNNDQHLDSLVTGAGENHVRYVFPVGDDRYFVREGGHTEGGAVWRLYRIPFRSDTAAQVGLPDLRRIRALRMTAVIPDGPQPERPIVLALARMKLVGAPWVKRAATPVAGIAGGVGQAHGEIIASVVSTENALDLGYSSPPGVIEAGANRGGNFQVGASQINERSLRLLGSDVRPGERAEAFFRFADGERSFLGYRQMRVWARGRGPGWATRELSFYIKVAQDENNFYLYRQPLQTTTWEPEAVVDFRRWLALRALIEQRYLRGDPPSGAATCGGDPQAWVACDSSGAYVVHVRNPGVAPPNLTSVQELAVGFVRDSGAALDSAELWVDDIRLTQVVDDAGYAGAVTAHLSAADIADFDLGLTRRDHNFRQLGDDPTYLATNQLSFGAAVRLERFGLGSLGIAAPLNIRVERSGTDPFYLNRTDVAAADLPNLRRPSSGTTSYALSLRRTRRGTLWWQRGLVDNLSLSGQWSSGRAVTELSRGASRTSTLRADYLAQVPSRSVSYMPGFLRRWLGDLPAFLSQTEAVRGLREGRLRLTPSLISFGTELTRASNDRVAFRVPIETAADSLSRPVAIRAAVLRNRATVELRPFAAASMGATLASDRDLRDYGDSTTLGLVARGSRRQLAGINVGFERTRQVSTRVGYNPAIASWVRPRTSVTSTFFLTRDPDAGQAERDSSGTGGFRLPTSYSNERATEVAGSVDLSRPMRTLFGDSSALRRAFDRVLPIDLSRVTDRRSQFTRPGFDPPLGYQLAMGSSDGFRSLDGTLATAASRTREDRLATGLRLPLGFGLSGAYAKRASLQWLLRGPSQQEFRQEDTDWPNVTGRWLWTPGGRIARVLTSVNATLGIRRRISTTVQPGLNAETAEQGAVRGTQETRSAPASLSISWPRRLFTVVAVSRERSRAERTGSATLSDRGSVSADITFPFRIPPEYVPLRSEVRTTLRYLHSTSNACIDRSGTGTCVRIADSRRSEYVLLMDTDMPPNAAASLSVSYQLNEDVHANRKTSQFVITAAVRVVFQAGEVR